MKGLPAVSWSWALVGTAGLAVAIGSATLSFGDNAPLLEPVEPVLLTAAPEHPQVPVLLAPVAELGEILIEPAAVIDLRSDSAPLVGEAGSENGSRLVRSAEDGRPNGNQAPSNHLIGPLRTDDDDEDDDGRQIPSPVLSSLPVGVTDDDDHGDDDDRAGSGGGGQRSDDDDGEADGDSDSDGSADDDDDDEDGDDDDDDDGSSDDDGDDD